MTIKIAIVNYEGQLWFEFNGLKFDTLNAIWELDREWIQVIRTGNMIARVRVTEARGEPVFNDYGVGGSIRLQGSDLRAEDFALDDRLVLDVPDGFDLVRNLKESCGFLEAVIATMPVGKKMSLDAMRDLVTPELNRTQQIMDGAQILRFRRGK